MLATNRAVALDSNAVRALRDAPPSPHADALRDAIITNHAAIPAATKARLALLTDKYLQP